MSQCIAIRRRNGVTTRIVQSVDDLIDGISTATVKVKSAVSKKLRPLCEVQGCSHRSEKGSTYCREHYDIIMGRRWRLANAMMTRADKRHDSNIPR